MVWVHRVARQDEALQQACQGELEAGDALHAAGAAAAGSSAVAVAMLQLYCAAQRTAAASQPAS